MSDLQEIVELVFSKLLNFLSYRDRTKKELVDKTHYYLEKYSLTEAESAEVIESIVERLNRANLIDDSKFAKNFIRSKLTASRPFGRKKITQKLLEKGVSRAVIENELANIPQEFERQTVEVLFEKKFKSIGASTTLESKHKIIKYLLGRGCSPTLVYSVVDSKFKD